MFQPKIRAANLQKSIRFGLKFGFPSFDGGPNLVLEVF